MTAQPRGWTTKLGVIDPSGVLSMCGPLCPPQEGTAGEGQGVAAAGTETEEETAQAAQAAAEQ